jgi:hypothetical protein
MKYTVVLCDTYLLLHAVGLFIILTMPTKPTTYVCSVVIAGSDGQLSDKTRALHRTSEILGNVV